MGLYIGYSTYQKQILHLSLSSITPLPPPLLLYFPPSSSPNTLASYPPYLSSTFQYSPIFQSPSPPPHPSFIRLRPPISLFTFPFSLPQTPFSQIDLSRLLSWLINLALFEGIVGVGVSMMVVEVGWGWRVGGLEGCGLDGWRVVGCGLWTVDCGLWAVGCGFSEGRGEGRVLGWRAALFQSGLHFLPPPNRFATPISFPPFRFPPFPSFPSSSPSSPSRFFNLFPPTPLPFPPRSPTSS